MKLNYRRTFFVGFAFFLICLFWQAYDNIIPKILIDKFGMSQTLSGVIMALDNVLALFLLPLFGSLSDRCKSKLGRRTPFIITGTICAVVFFLGLSFVDNLQKKYIGKASEFVQVNNDEKNPYYAIDLQGMEDIWNSENGKLLVTADGEVFSLGYAEGSTNIISKQQFMNITSMPSDSEISDSQISQGIVNQDFFKYAVTARQSYVQNVTKQNRWILIIFIFVLLVLLISMASFRSPSVALMPDITIKPLRSKANAVINLMGSAGGILVLVLGMVFKTGKYYKAMTSYTSYFLLLCTIMLIALFVFVLNVKEPLFVKEMKEESRKYGLEKLPENNSEEKRKLSFAEKKSLFFIMASIVLWFMGYNAVTSKYSVYAGSVLNLDYNFTLIVAQAAAIVSYFPVGLIASKVGRKKTILCGIIMLTVSFAIAAVLRSGSSPILMNVMFALAGIGWATINVNSFPMVVELSRDSDVGKYTGFYYTASMAAQTLTPFLSGFLMDKTGKMTVLFPYAAFCVALAFVTMLFVKHGDSKPFAKQVVQQALSSEYD